MNIEMSILKVFLILSDYRLVIVGVFLCGFFLAVLSSTMEIFFNKIDLGKWVKWIGLVILSLSFGAFLGSITNWVFIAPVTTELSLMNQLGRQLLDDKNDYRVYKNNVVYSNNLLKGSIATVDLWRFDLFGVKNGLVPDSYGKRLRIIGVPGDYVELNINNEIVINGKIIPDSIPRLVVNDVEMPKLEFPITLGTNQFWLSDPSYKYMQYDSRYFGFVDKKYFSNVWTPISEE